MANRNQDDQGRDRGGYRGREDEYEEGDSSARAGRYDQGRQQFGRDTDEQSGSTGRYAGYGEWGQGDYSGQGRGANTGQNRYGMTGAGGGRDQGYGQGNYSQDRGGSQSSNYGQSNQGSGRYDRERGGDQDSGRDFGYGYGRAGGESQHRGSQGSQYGQRGGSGQSPGYAGPGYGYGGSGTSQSGGAQFGGSRPGSEFGYGAEQGGGSQYGPGLHRGKGPKGYQRSDERLKEMISERLRDDPHVDASDITVNVSAGKVTLEGTVDSRHAKNIAEDIVEHCGCEDVQNNLRVQRTQSPESSMSNSTRSTSGNDEDKGESTKQRH